jgi:hypothetical protein
MQSYQTPVSGHRKGNFTKLILSGYKDLKLAGHNKNQCKPMTGTPRDRPTKALLIVFLWENIDG